MKHGWCEQVGEVKLTRAQYKEYWALLYAYDMQQYSYRVWKARQEDAKLKKLEEQQIAEEEKELSRWHWRAIGIFIFLGALSLIIASLAGKYDFDFMIALSPLVPAIGVAVWGDQMEQTLLAGKNPWTDLLKTVLFSVIILVLLYFSFIFIIAILLLLKPSKLFRR